MLLAFFLFDITLMFFLRYFAVYYYFWSLVYFSGLVLLDWGEVSYFPLLPGYLILQRDINFWGPAIWFYTGIIMSEYLESNFSLEESHERQTTVQMALSQDLFCQYVCRRSLRILWDISYMFCCLFHCISRTKREKY